uniref:Secreted protein n=1 Tax=Rhizophora mucronata TaxID=61149 RepID=A0A2P2JUF0_RHIMU
MAATLSMCTCMVVLPLHTSSLITGFVFCIKSDVEDISSVHFWKRILCSHGNLMEVKIHQKLHQTVAYNCFTEM